MAAKVFASRVTDGTNVSATPMGGGNPFRGWVARTSSEALFTRAYTVFPGLAGVQEGYLKRETYQLSNELVVPKDKGIPGADLEGRATGQDEA